MDVKWMFDACFQGGSAGKAGETRERTEHVHEGALRSVSGWTAGLASPGLVEVAIPCRGGRGYSSASRRVRRIGPSVLESDHQTHAANG